MDLVNGCETLKKTLYRGSEITVLFAKRWAFWVDYEIKRG